MRGKVIYMKDNLIVFPVDMDASDNITISGTIYEVNTYFNNESNQCLLEQFRKIYMSEQVN